MTVAIRRAYARPSWFDPMFRREKPTDGLTDHVYTVLVKTELVRVRVPVAHSLPSHVQRRILRTELEARLVDTYGPGRLHRDEAALVWAQSA